jgi:hypothetical protein
VLIRIQGFYGWFWVCATVFAEKCRAKGAKGCHQKTMVDKSEIPLVVSNQEKVPACEIVELSRRFMKKPLPYEMLATVLAIFGALLLVGVYMPIINPGLTRVETHEELPSIGYYIVGTPIPLGMLLASWYFNRKAQSLKREEKPKDAKSGKLKWFLFGVVVLIVLYAFLW